MDLFLSLAITNRNRKAARVKSFVKCVNRIILRKESLQHHTGISLEEEHPHFFLTCTYNL